MRILCSALILICSHLQAQNLPERLTALFDTLAQRGQFRGTALVGEKGRILWHRAYGKAQENPDRLLTENSVFELASVTKPFTALAIMQLKEKGLLAYDDPVRRYLPKFPYQEVTLLDLINHRSGLTDFMGWPEQVIYRPAPISNQDILNHLAQTKPSLAAQPGSGFRYSNTNYVLLAMVIEQVSGESYSAYMDKHIFTPASLKRTAIRSRNKLMAFTDHADGFAWNGSTNRIVPASEVHRYIKHFPEIYGAYGMTSTGPDLFHLVQAVLGDKLVSRHTWDQATSYADTSNISMSFGWELIPGPEGKRDILATGLYGGYTSIIFHQYATEKTVILLSNASDETDLVAIMDPISILLEHGSPTIPSPPARKKGITLTPAQLLKFAGKYRVDGSDDNDVSIVVDSNRLYARPTGMLDQPLFPESTTKLYSRDRELIFEREQNKHFQSLRIVYPNGEMHLNRID